MRAHFHLNADLSISVESMLHGQNVNLTVYRGVCYEHKPGEECKEVQAQTLALGKSEARAIASAMMGCAAEL